MQTTKRVWVQGPRNELIDESAYYAIQSQAFVETAPRCHTCDGVIERISDAVVSPDLRHLTHRPGRCLQ